MKNKFANATFCLMFTLAPLTAFAANPDHERQDSYARDKHDHAFQSNRNGHDSRATVSVPEPTSLILLGTGLVGLILSRRKQNS